jgi:hypothetical protein
MHRRVVLGLCPEIYRPELEFLFVTVTAELFNGFWVRRAHPEQLFPPKGDIWVPREVFPEDFHEADAVAWEVEDQPDYAERHLSCRFRAIRLADAPVELVSVPWPSTDEALRQTLLETGVPFFPRRADRNILLDFQDSIVVRVRLLAHPTNPKNSIVSDGDLAHPLDAWPSGKLPSLLNVDSRRGQRHFCTLPVLPAAPSSLDLSTLEEALTAAKRPGGLGFAATLSAPELRHHLKRLEEVLHSFDGPAWQGRRTRLEQFLSNAHAATEERARWEAFLTSHPIFREALEAAVTSARSELRLKVRTELLGEEKQLQENLQRLSKEWEDLEAVKVTAEAEVKTLRNEAATLAAQRPSAQAPTLTEGAPHSPQRDGSDNGSPLRITAANANRIAEGAGAAVPPSLKVGIPLAAPGEDISAPGAALALLEKNLQALGIIRISSRLVAREVLVAASMGQLLLFRGSLAGPVAEAVAVSLGGSDVKVIPVRLGTTLPLELPAEGARPGAIIFEGINRSCLDAFGTAIQEQIRSRVFGFSQERLPVFLGTLGEGPSCLPLGTHLLGFGPVFDNQARSLSQKKRTARRNGRNSSTNSFRFLAYFGNALCAAHTAGCPH